MQNWLIVAVVAWGTITAWTAPAVSQPFSVWDGSYTAEQAERGAAKYRQHCVMCHGPVLEGNGEAPPLVGRFIPDWAGTSLADLFDKIQVTMPLFAPGTMTSSDTADILAFILQANNFPTGPKDLRAGDALKLISFDVVRPVVNDAAAGKRH